MPDTSDIPAQNGSAPRLAAFLKPEIDSGKVSVEDFADRSVVTIRGDGFFEPGSAVVASGVRPLLGRIAQALASTPGSVVITGHTDNVPIRTLRFPSNWHLSQERAEAVRQDLAQNVPGNRLRADGRADAEPVAENGTPAGRAKKVNSGMLPRRACQPVRRDQNPTSASYSTGARSRQTWSSRLVLRSGAVTSRTGLSPPRQGASQKRTPDGELSRNR